MNMNRQTLAATMLLMSSTAVVASDYEQVAFADEAKSCIAEVNQSIDYDDATRVLHNVVELKNTFSGYVLSIDTEVFTDSDAIAARKYAAHCIAKADARPKKFTIQKVSG